MLKSKETQNQRKRILAEDYSKPNKEYLKLNTPCLGKPLYINKLNFRLEI